MLHILIHMFQVLIENFQALNNVYVIPLFVGLNSFVGGEGRRDWSCEVGQGLTM